MLEIFVLFLFILTLPGSLELALLIIGFFINRPKPILPVYCDKRIAVVIPAYNEEKQIAKTIESLKNNDPNCTLIVIADNCTDKTAEIALHHGVRVIKRENSVSVGKHFALNYAFSILLKENFDLFLIVDADCIAAPNLIQEVKNSFNSSVDVVQVEYRVDDASLDFKQRLLRISFNAFVYFRPLGRQGWHLSTGIFGTGFAVKKSVLENVKIPTNSIVEDTCFHLRLVEYGYFTNFNPKTYVKTALPKTMENISSQRSRWEGGRIRLFIEELPRAIKFLFKGNFRMIEPCLDLSLLPVSFHAILLIILLLIPIKWTQIYALTGLSLLVLYVLITMIICKARWRDYCALFLAPFYLLAKLLFISKLVKQFKKQPLWEKTPREEEENHNLKENL